MANNMTKQEVDKEMHAVQVELAREAKKFAAVLPQHIPLPRFQRVIMTALMNNSDLLLVPADMFLRECLKAAQDGLLPDGREGALVPRGNAKKGNISCTWQPMIAGIRKKARNSGEISSWDAHAAYANDKFHVRLGDDPKIDHEIDFTAETRGDVIAFYSVAIMKDGTKSFDVMTVSDVNKIRDRSDAYKAFKNGWIKSTPWESDYEQMGIKTVAKRHSKQLPMSSDLDDLIRRDDDLYNFSQDGKVQDGVGQIAKPSQRSLENRLDELADSNGEGGGTSEHDGETIDNETGEIVDDKKSSGKDAGGEKEKSDEPKGPTKRDIANARKAGVEDAKEGVKKRDMPSAYRSVPDLRSAYVEGHDSVTNAAES